MLYRTYGAIGVVCGRLSVSYYILYVSGWTGDLFSEIPCRFEVGERSDLGLVITFFAFSPRFRRKPMGSYCFVNQLRNSGLQILSALRKKPITVVILFYWCGRGRNLWNHLYLLSFRNHRHQAVTTLRIRVTRKSTFLIHIFLHGGLGFLVDAVELRQRLP